MNPVDAAAQQATGGGRTIRGTMSMTPDSLFAIAAIGIISATSNLYGQWSPSIDINLGGDAQFVVVDSLGRRTGFDPIAKREYKEIPEAFYGDEGVGSLDSCAQDISGKAFSWLSPQPGTYIVKVIGVRKGHFGLGVFLSGASEAQSRDFYFNGNSDTGSVTEYRFHFSLDTTKTLSAEPLIRPGPK
jgi:hypothetical protein